MKTEAKRLSRSVVEADTYAYRALEGITGYTPIKTDLTLEKVTKAYEKVLEFRGIETIKESEYKAAYDNSVEAEHAFHQLILEVKNQVRAQFGSNSNEVQSLGLKKKSEYKSPARKK